MLTSDLLQFVNRGGMAYPTFLKGARESWAEKVLEVITAHLRKTRGELQHALKSLEGDSPDYRLVRGLAHLALERAEFTVFAPIAPELLRREAFLQAAGTGHGPHAIAAIAREMATKYELAVEVVPEMLYADLPENQVLVSVPELTPQKLVERYNLAQAQGLLYYANQLVITAHRNVPGEYRRLFHRIKFYGLMYAVEGNLDDGYRIYVDGPASLLRQNQKYGVKMAAFLPALLNVSRWELEANLFLKGKSARYTVTSDAPLVSHYPKPPEFDSLLEASFVERWNKLKTPWALEREVEIIDLKGTVFVPDFAVRHTDNRVAHVEIVGFWHPDYLRRKFDKVKRAGMKNLVLAVSDRLKVTDDHLEGVPGPVIFFKGKVDPRAVIETVETMEAVED